MFLKVMRYDVISGSTMPVIAHFLIFTHGMQKSPYA
jgi:uncharacterized membrane protein